MKSRFTLLLTALVVVLAAAMLSGDIAAAKKKRTINSVKREQQATEKSIRETSRKLDDNVKKTERNLIRLNQLDGELQLKSEEIGRLQSSLRSLDDQIRTATDSAAILDAQLQSLKRQYARALRKLQGTYRDSDILSFIFSSGSFSEAAARYRYLREFADWRKRKQAEISIAGERVRNQKQLLGRLHSDRQSSLSTLSGAESELRVKRDEVDRVVADLKKEGSALQKTIARNQQRLKSLDSELDRMIVAEQKRQERLRQAEARRKAEEQRKARAAKRGSSKNSRSTSSAAASRKSSGKSGHAANAEISGLAAADRALSGSFESNKGRLLFPVRGSYSVVRSFGRHTHPDLPNVVTDNPGIDIAAASGSKARCIFEGTVSGVFTQDGFNKVVMVRHGHYISIYANLSSINVKTGDKVKANQDIGTIYADPQFNNRPVLHFEIRRERTKLNPLQWVR